MRSLVILLAVCVSGCGLCSERVVQTRLSSDGKVVATVVVRDCGATTSEVTLILIKSRYRWLGLDEKVVANLKYTHDVDVNWLASDQLVINCKSCAGDQDVQFEHQWRDVKIQFVQSAGPTRGQEKKNQGQ